MFMCIVVAFEVALLCAAFWYVFVREEKPYKVIGDPWGNYSGITDPTKGMVCGEISWDRAGKATVISTLDQSKITCEPPKAA